MPRGVGGGVEERGVLRLASWPRLHLRSGWQS